VSPEELSVRDPDFIDVLYQSGRRNKWEKNSNANGSPGSIASTNDFAVHRARRAPLSPFFSKRAITALESTVKDKVDRLTAGIEQQHLQTGKVLTLAVPFVALTLDVISDYCFGQSWRCLDAPDFSPQWKRGMSDAFEGTPVVKAFPFLPRVIGLIPQGPLRSIMPALALFQETKDVSRQVRTDRSSY
jgi:hypothetical protein